MKRTFAALLAAVLLLGGCGKEQPSVTPDEPTSMISGETFVQYLDDDSLQDKDVKRYALQLSDCYAMIPMGEGVLFLSGDTTLTYLEEGGDPVQNQLPTHIDPRDPAFHVMEDGVCYYDDMRHELVFLDKNLQESSRMVLSREINGRPVLSDDWQYLYYYTQDALRCLELKTGISRLLQESSAQSQQVLGACFEGQVLECRVVVDKLEKTRYISAATGQILFETEGQLRLDTRGQYYCTRWQDAIVFGKRGEQPQQLQVSLDKTFFPLLAGGYMIACAEGENGVNVSCYDVDQGDRISSMVFERTGMPQDFLYQSSNGRLWMLGQTTKQEGQTIYCWDPTQNQICGERFVTPFFSTTAPDHAGLEQCQQLASRVGQDHNVVIKIWDQADDAMPSNHWMTLQHRVDVYEQCLASLDRVLSLLPGEMLTKIGKNSACNKLTICLVGELWGINEVGSKAPKDGVYFRNSGNGYLMLATGEDFEQKLYHELFHVIDSYVLTESKRYDTWDRLNPPGFSYDYSYIANQGRQAGDYLNPNNRWFIDVFSMSYPREDRARIWEYAVQSGNSSYFATMPMKCKLDALCQGIREAFEIQNGTTLIWEQYL